MRDIYYQSLLEPLINTVPERPFVTMWNSEEDVQTVTFGEFMRQVKIQAANFQSLGLNYNDRVVLIMPQGIPLLVAFVAAMWVGAVPAILAYPNFKVEPSKYRSGLAGVSANLHPKLVVLDEAFPQELLDYVAIQDGTQIVRSKGTLPGDETALVQAPVAVKSDSLAFIQHSAGTTGLQKGVALTHAAVLRQLDHLTRGLRITDSDSIYSWLPLYHDMGLIACFMLPLVYQLPIVMQSPTEWVMQPATMLALISQFGSTLAWVPNFTLQFLARRVRPEDRADYDLSSLRAIINCSEPVRAQSMDEFLTAFQDCGLSPKALQTSYAMAENVFAVTQSGTGPESLPHRIRVSAAKLRNEHRADAVQAPEADTICLVSSGRCLPGNSVRIVGPDRHDLPDGTIGEIWIQSDSLFNGYYNRLDLTDQVLANGWYNSGDLGLWLDGELYVTGRKKDLIIVAGKNIYPQDVEEIACSHPEVHDGRAVAFGVMNRSMGTEDIVVVAEVENIDGFNQGLHIEKAIRNAVVAELGVAVKTVYLKPPHWIVKSTAGKLARSATRDKLLAEHPELSED